MDKHKVADAGRVAELEAQCSHLASVLAERTEQLTESRKREGRMRDAAENFIRMYELPAWHDGRDLYSAVKKMKDALAANKEQTK